MGLSRPAPWCTIPLVAVIAVAVATVTVSRSNRRELRRRARTRAAQDAASFLSAVGRLDSSADDKDSVVIELNSPPRRIAVAPARLRSVGRSLPRLLNVYAVACRCDGVLDETRADVWNCMCAIVEAQLSAYVGAATVSTNAAEAAAALALGETLLCQRYHVSRFVAASSSSTPPRPLCIRALPVQLMSAAARQARAESSPTRSLVLFARLLRRTCTRPQVLLLAALVVANVAYISPFLGAAASTTAPSSLLYTVRVLEELKAADAAQRCTCWAFLSRVVSASPARLLAGVSLGSLVSCLLASARDAASDGVLRHSHMALKLDTLLSLARCDAVADAHWPLPGRLYSALCIVTSFSLADVDRLLGVLAERVQRWRTVWRLPVACAAGWLTRQGLDWLQLRWTRVCLMTAFVANYGTCDEDAGVASAAARDAAAVSLFAAAGSVYRAHFGLQALLLAATGASLSPALRWLAESTRWPVSPPRCLATTDVALGAVCAAAEQSHILRARHSAIRQLCADAAAASAEAEAESEAPSFAATLGERRACGDCHAAEPTGAPAIAMAWLRLDGELVEELVDRVLTSCRAMPTMAAMAAVAATRGAAAALETPEAAAAAAYEVARVVDAGAVFAVPPSQPWTHTSSFQFDLEVAKLPHHGHETYARSVASLLYMQHTHRPTLDGRLWAQYNTPPSLLQSHGGDDSGAGWRVTFDHVFFRYPGATRDALHDVSFDLAAGGLLGIVGYSGAGKSTLLLLLARIYAPTSGHIRIDGHPIEDIPPRALRRRLGSCWQGDSDACLLEDVSVECNVAYGNLAAACADTVTTSLERACLSDAVAARPNGLREPLRSREWSGGEVARLMVARALMVTPDVAGVYLLDECASGLDSVTEARVFASDALRPPRRPTTRVVVSHRLASVRDADEILVLADGRVVERGSWAQLLRDDGDGHNTAFQTLYRAQAGLPA
ncbi:ABC transporter family-like protein [Novymonas esmeraldas]|uniref:ABC transporter family-like protein n=1 Tax=Novymonas esmeraldas TaxID=1808958 RepID=A0AAW0ETB1_9TRYP